MASSPIDSGDMNLNHELNAHCREKRSSNCTASEQLDEYSAMRNLLDDDFLFPSGSGASGITHDANQQSGFMLSATDGNPTAKDDLFDDTLLDLNFDALGSDTLSFLSDLGSTANNVGSEQFPHLEPASASTATPQDVARELEEARARLAELENQYRQQLQSRDPQQRQQPLQGYSPQTAPASLQNHPYHNIFDSAVPSPTTPIDSFNFAQLSRMNLGSLLEVISQQRAHTAGNPQSTMLLNTLENLITNGIMRQGPGLPMDSQLYARAINLLMSQHQQQRPQDAAPPSPLTPADNALMMNLARRLSLNIPEQSMPFNGAFHGASAMPSHAGLQRRMSLPADYLLGQPQSPFSPGIGFNEMPGTSISHLRRFSCPEAGTFVPHGQQRAHHTLSGGEEPDSLGRNTLKTFIQTIGRYTKKEREARIERYRLKRQQRTFNKKIRYQCRKQLADSRPRFKGRFCKVNPDQLEAMASLSDGGSPNEGKLVDSMTSSPAAMDSICSSKPPLHTATASQSPSTSTAARNVRGEEGSALKKPPTQRPNKRRASAPDISLTILPNKTDVGSSNNSFGIAPSSSTALLSSAMSPH